MWRRPSPPDSSPEPAHAVSEAAASGAVLVELDGVQKRYSDGTLALSDISFATRDGEFVSLVGPSGSGKSTLLRLIAGLGEATAGTVLIGGLPPPRARRERGDMAFVFQDPTLLPWRTVQGNVEFPLELRGATRAERRAAAQQALSTVGLRDVAGQYPRRLSGGMRMRVSIARAL